MGSIERRIDSRVVQVEGQATGEGYIRSLHEPGKIQSLRDVAYRGWRGKSGFVTSRGGCRTSSQGFTTKPSRRGDSQI